jgi:hypothetical protein
LKQELPLVRVGIPWLEPWGGCQPLPSAIIG